jgi:hypothetical protein
MQNLWPKDLLFDKKELLKAQLTCKKCYESDSHESKFKSCSKRSPPKKGAMKVIRMNQNLRAAQNAAHLKRKREFNAIIEILK